GPTADDPPPLRPVRRRRFHGGVLARPGRRAAHRGPDPACTVTLDGRKPDAGTGRGTDPAGDRMRVHRDGGSEDVWRFGPRLGGVAVFGRSELKAPPRSKAPAGQLAYVHRWMRYAEGRCAYRLWARVVQPTVLLATVLLALGLAAWQTGTPREDA